MAESIERVERALAAADQPIPVHPWRVRADEVLDVDDNWVGTFDDAGDAALAVTAHNLLPRFIDVVRAAGGHAHEFGHATPCELCDALAALDTAIREELPDHD